MGFMDRITAGYRAGQQKAEEEKIIKRHTGERKRRQELKEAQQNPSQFGMFIGKAESKTRPAREKISKTTPKIASGIKKAHGMLVDIYGNPQTSTGTKRTRRKTTKRSGSQTIKIVHVTQGRTTRRKKKSSSDSDDFFSSRGF